MTDERRRNRDGPRLPRDAVGRGLGRRAAAAYQGALEAILAIVITMAAGWWLDRRFGTEPGFLLLGAVIGFVAFVVRVWRLRDLMVPEPDPATDGVRDDGRKDGRNGDGSRST